MQTLKEARPKESSLWDWLVVALFLHQDVRYAIRGPIRPIQKPATQLSWDL